MPVHDGLIELVPENAHVIARVRTPSIGKHLKGHHKNLDFEVHKKLPTIWLRDVAGFSCGERIVKRIFRPKYYRGAFARARRTDHHMKCISEILGKEIVTIPLIWDGGNLVSSGTVGLITERF